MVTHPHQARQTKVGWAYALPAVVSIAMIAACVPTKQTDAEPTSASPELFEFANMRQSNIIPKSSATAFVRAFDSFCLKGGKSAATIARKLRSKDYVAAPRVKGSPQTAFVVDDSRPMVVIADNGRFCAVAAISRTGQTAKVHAFVASHFPSAPAVENTMAGVEMLRRTGGSNAGLIVLKRRAFGVSNSQLVLAIQRDN